MGDYSELKRLADRVISDRRFCGDENHKALADGVIALIAENERLKGLQPEFPPRPPDGDGLPRYGLRWNGPQQPLAVPMDDGYWVPWYLADQLKAESEDLRNDLEQTQYDADAWRNPEESVWVQVFRGEGDNPFISAVQGAICIEQVALIQGEILENAEDYLEQGPGFYVFECRHCEAHYDNVGMTEPAHWEIDFSEYARFPWADEQAETSSETNHD